MRCVVGGVVRRGRPGRAAPLEVEEAVLTGGQWPWAAARGRGRGVGGAGLDPHTPFEVGGSARLRGAGATQRHLVGSGCVAVVLRACMCGMAGGGWGSGSWQERSGGGSWP